MKESVNVKWVDGMTFEADVMGYKIMIDSDPEHGGQKKGPKPKPLMMVALAGCTGMDIVSLLNKMRVDYKELNIFVEGELSEEHPKKFLNMTVIFRLVGKNIDRKKVEKAIELSKEKYCGVSASYRDAMVIEYKLEIEDPD
ncbi:MAG: OsmC family protein [Bacteroidales bacterium]|nr:OsmC family protein [Bacteroidales bacterium]